jgi:hypothetical protein
MLKITNFARLYIIRILQHFATKLWNITNFVMLFQAVMKFCLDLLRSKFWLMGNGPLANHIALFCSHDNTGYLVKYIDPGLGLDLNYFSPWTGSKLVHLTLSSDLFV